MRIATWNIAGGHTLRSLKTFDYETDIRIGYFISQLRSLHADIVCLQESQCNDTDSIARQIARGLDMLHVFETPMHPSHIDVGYDLSLAILSLRPLHNAQALAQPYPSFDLYLPNGQLANRWDNYVQMAEIGGIHVANTMTQPLEFLGHPYDDPHGRRYASELNAMFMKVLARPLVFAGDFNTPDPEETFAATCQHLHLKDGLPRHSTKPHGSGHLDCVFYSDELIVRQAAIMPTQTDHFLCWADIDFRES